MFEDYIGYLSDNTFYRHMTVFIYDESCSVQEHDTTRNALLRLSGITDVIIVSRPSRIPVPGRTQRRRRSTGHRADDAPRA
ncbi:PD-(D/E)XK nuclease domain-containing protein [Streptomyces sp. NPDC054940]